MATVTHFPIDKLKIELDNVLTASEHLGTWGEVTGPGMWLVGDDGIYFMGNQKRDGASLPYTVVYAREADPTTMDSDAVYDAKTEIFGGDDGVEFFSYASMSKIVEDGIRKGNKWLVVTFTPTSIELALG